MKKTVKMASFQQRVSLIGLILFPDLGLSSVRFQFQFQFQIQIQIQIQGIVVILHRMKMKEVDEEG